jgi:hypothetical protein
MKPIAEIICDVRELELQQKAMKEVIVGQGGSDDIFLLLILK